jgi:acetolactate synthase I/II/III large subunit
MKGAELIVACLENEEVEYIFGIPGEENMHVLDALLGSQIRFVTTRHEQGAAFMANIYGRLTGNAGVCLSTLGPGATNLITGIAEANMDHAPLVALTGQVSLDNMHKESHQYLDIASLFRTITKWNTSLHIPDMIPETIRKAFKLAQTEKTGATHVEIPEDVVKLNSNETPLLVQYPHPGQASTEQIERAARIISESVSPVLIAGNGAIRGRASESLKQFAEKLNIPIVTTFMGKGLISDNHPLSFGAIGLQAHDYVNFGLDQADVVIAVGYDLVEYSPRLWNPQRNKKIIHVDMSPAEVDTFYIVAVGVIGEISSSLENLAATASPRQSYHASKQHQLLLDEIEQYRDDTSVPLKPQKIISDLRSVLGDDDIVISDVGAHKIWLARMYPCYKPNTCIISNGFSSMGVAVPGAVAAKLIFPERGIVAVTGDGGFLMNSQELETAMRMRTSFVVLILNDRTYGLIKWKQMDNFGRSAFVDFMNPDFVRYAESFGAKGYRIERASDLVPTLKAALNDKTVAIIDCPVDFSENLKLTERLGRLVGAT